MTEQDKLDIQVPKCGNCISWKLNDHKGMGDCSYKVIIPFSRLGGKAGIPVPVHEFDGKYCLAFKAKEEI